SFIDDHRLWHSARVIAPVDGEVGAWAAGSIAKMRVAPDQAPDELLGVGIEQQLVRIESKTALRIIGTIDPVAVGLSRRDIVEIAVPDVLGALGQRDPLDLASTVAVEQAKLDLLGVGGKQCEIGAAPVPGRPERMRRSGRQADATAPG